MNEIAKERALRKAEYREFDARFEAAVKTLSEMDATMKAALADERVRCATKVRLQGQIHAGGGAGAYELLAQIIERGDKRKSSAG